MSAEREDFRVTLKDQESTWHARIQLLRAREMPPYHYKIMQALWRVEIVQAATLHMNKMHSWVTFDHALGHEVVQFEYSLGVRKGQRFRWYENTWFDERWGLVDFIDDSVPNWIYVMDGMIEMGGLEFEDWEG